jgi:hypothetical protein
MKPKESFITFSEGENAIFWSRVYNIEVELELFGCDNYVLDEGEFNE